MWSDVLEKKIVRVSMLPISGENLIRGAATAATIRTEGIITSGGIQKTEGTRTEAKMQ